MSTALVQESGKFFIKAIQRDLTAITVSDTKATSAIFVQALIQVPIVFCDYLSSSVTFLIWQEK